jgi:hypothetical protein
MLNETRITVNAKRARKVGHSVPIPLPFNIAPREIIPKC